MRTQFTEYNERKLLSEFDPTPSYVLRIYFKEH